METKICTKCGIEKPIEEYHWRDKSAGTRRSEGKECHNKQVKSRYKENKQVIDNLKDGKSCIRCGYNECVEALDYHHIDPSTKINTVAKLATHYNLKDGLAETEKCILLCANCHRYFHYLKRQNHELTLIDFIQ